MYEVHAVGEVLGRKLPGWREYVILVFILLQEKLSRDAVHVHRGLVRFTGRTSGAGLTG